MATIIVNTRSSEDVDALAMDAGGDLFLSTTGTFFVPGLSGRDEDIFGYTPSSSGIVTRGDFADDLFFNGSQIGLAGSDIKGIDLTFNQI
ncbi:MAG: hypothetical protein AAGD25_23570 [Cyanobacteria bacterium P01_F01_bin.150]